MWMHAGAFSAGYTAFVATFPTRDFSVSITTNSHTAQPWLLVMSALPLLDDSLRALPTPPTSDPDVRRTARLRALFSGDSTALPMTPGFGAFAYGAVKARFSGMSEVTLTFLGCDDLRHSKAALPDLATSECYYRVGTARDGIVLGVYFTDSGAVADVRTKG